MLGVFILAVWGVKAAAHGETPPEVISVTDIPYVQREGASAELTSLDIHAPADCERCPVLIFLHGGTWVQGDKQGGNSKISTFTRAGWLLVSVNYRLSPDVRHPQHVRDVAAAIVWVHRHIVRYHGDPHRIFLMGHSAGGHLAALVACDDRYLQAMGEHVDLIKGVVGLDSAAYALTDLFRSEPEHLYLFTLAFGENPEGWKDASPVSHVASDVPIPPFLLIYAGDRDISRHSALTFAEALHQAGVPVQVYHAAEQNHVSVERDVGHPRDSTTAVILAFLQRLASPAAP